MEDLCKSDVKDRFEDNPVKAVPRTCAGTCGRRLAARSPFAFTLVLELDSLESEATQMAEGFEPWMKNFLVVKLIVAIIRLCKFQALFPIVKEAGGLAITYFDP
jgi:hypothetical protein